MPIHPAIILNYGSRDDDYTRSLSEFLFKLNDFSDRFAKDNDLEKDFIFESLVLSVFSWESTGFREISKDAEGSVLERIHNPLVIDEAAKSMRDDISVLRSL